MKSIKLDQIELHIENDTLYIGCSSYEERCLSVAKNISMQKITKALIASSEDLRTYVDENNAKLTELFGDKALNVSLRTDDPIISADNLKESLENCLLKADNILVDITTFTHELLLILVKLLSFMVKKNTKVKFVYTGAESYGLTQEGEDRDEKSEAIWLSKGVSDIRNVLGFAGEIYSSKETHLIILVGFEYERALELIREYEPNYLTLGFGRPGGSISEKHQKANKRFHSLLNELTSSWQHAVNFEFSCDDPIESRDAICQQVQKYPDTNVVIAPMNTKISTLGAYLANQQNDAIQICYAKPSVYNYANYSTPGNSCYIFELPEIFNTTR